LPIPVVRPLAVGVFWIVDGSLGAVEYLGIKSTRLRSLGGEQIVMSNADLLGSRVRNYGRMAERRVVFANSFPYETPIDRIEQIPALIKRIIESQPDTRFDRSHFMKHGAAAFEFETVYYVLSPDYNKYADTQQAINLQLHRELEKMGVKFAIPVQRLLIDESGKLAERADAKSATQSTEGSM